MKKVGTPGLILCFNTLLTPVIAEEPPLKTLPTGPFLIKTADVTAPDCQAHFNQLLKDKPLSPRLAEFRKAVCLFHQPLPNRLEIENTMILLRDLQTQGLWASQQSLAALMEGLLQCRLAKQAINTHNNNKGMLWPLEKLDFCAARRGAIASFADINWAYARFDYQAKSSKRVDDLLDEMASCYSGEDADKNEIVDGPLNPAFNERCQLLRLPEDRITAIIEDEADTVLKDQLGAKSALARIFLENKRLAESSKDRAEVAVKVLKQDSEQVVKVYKTLKAHYDAQISTVVTHMLGDYQHAYSVGKSIIDRYAQWQQGLLRDKNRDLSLDLIGASDQYGTEGINGRVRAQSIAMDKMQVQAQKIPELIKELQQKALETRKRALQLCQIYYCEMGKAGFLRHEVLLKACEPDEMRANPLCQIGVQSKATQFNVSQFCQKEVGFKFAKMQMNDEESERCFKE
jgi:hypothetical protein